MIDRSKYEAEDFLIDATFQQYCAGTDPLSISYWENYIIQNPHQKKVIAEAARLYKILSGNKAKLNEAVLTFQQQQDKKDKLPKQRRLHWAWTVAASIVIIAGIGLYTQKSSSVTKPVYTKAYQTKSGERKRFELPDGSIVWLNAKSTLEVDKDFNKKFRRVLLNGEGYFEVKHGKKPFQVNATGFTINVLGTSFNVRAYADEHTSETTLISGLISMKTENSAGLITLKPSQKVMLYRNVKTANVYAHKKEKEKRPEMAIDRYELAKDKTIVETAWTQGKIEILDQDFTEIKPILEKWYNVKIKFSDKVVEHYRFTATFSHENIGQVLQALQQVEKFEYEIKGDQITISK